MRIIAGDLRGRRIDAPDGQGTRPMLDRVREALFSTLGAEAVEGARVLDLFSGSGSLALEALSRGAAFARCVESGRKALDALHRNVEALGLGDKAKVVRADALKKSAWGDVPANLVFLDPPYATIEDPIAREKLLTALDLLRREHVTDDARLVLHAPARSLELLRHRFPGSDLRAYGDSALLYLDAERTGAHEQGSAP